LHLTPSRQSSPGLDQEAVHTLQEWPPQHAQQPPASASPSFSSSLQYSLQDPPFDFDFSCDLLSDYHFLDQQQQQDFNWADPLLFPDQQDLTSLAFPISTTTCDTATTSTTVSPFALSLPLSATPSPLLVDTNDLSSTLTTDLDFTQGWADPLPSAPPQPPMHLSLDHHLSSDDPYAAASLSHVTDSLSTAMGLTMPSGRNTTMGMDMDMYRTASNSGSSTMGYNQHHSSRDPSTTPPTSQASSTSPTSRSHHGQQGHGHLYPGLTLPSPADASNKPKRGRPPGPKKRAHSPAAEAELTDSEDVLVKRQRNNIAAKKYRQKN
jgi:beta-glucosidase